MSSWIRQSVWAIALFAGLAFACGAQAEVVAPPARETGSPGPAIPTAVSTPSVIPPESLGPEPDQLVPTGMTEEARVVRVNDGDTIVVDRGGEDERLRYIGMDTPETVKPGSFVEWMGREASTANRAQVEGMTVVLEKDVSETDSFGRLLRHVWLHGDSWQLVNLELIRDGFARVSTYPPDVKYSELYLAAQIDAREHVRGLWGAGPINFLAPEDGATVTTKSIVAQGTAPPGRLIVHDISKALDERVRADPDGAWSLEVQLKSGLNILRFRLDDEKDTTRTLRVALVP